MLLGAVLQFVHEIDNHPFTVSTRVTLSDENKQEEEEEDNPFNSEFFTPTPEFLDDEFENNSITVCNLHTLPGVLDSKEGVIILDEVSEIRFDNEIISTFLNTTSFPFLFLESRQS